YECYAGLLFMNIRGSLAMGVTHQVLDISGSQTRLVPGGAILTDVGGLLALPGANIGRFDHNAFSVVPEITVNLGCQVTRHLRTFVGYNFLYWTNVIRPGDQIDPFVDIARVPNFVPPGTPLSPIVRPTVLFKQSDFWVQGINFGVELRW